MINIKSSEVMNYLAVVVLERMGEKCPSQQQIDKAELVLQQLSEQLIQKRKNRALDLSEIKLPCLSNI